VLDEQVPFLTGETLPLDVSDRYFEPGTTTRTASVYEHCALALDASLAVGEHGLPLFGTGDWNDGMNRVGAQGKGESVWNGWFFITVLKAFADLADQIGDTSRAAWCRERAEALRAALEEHAWDGRWYRRAYFDDGTPLGSAENEECRIDCIAQSWSVISGAAQPQRARQAVASADEMLVRQEDGLILLFTPPFDKGKLDPGYIKGYVPGIRENGGQYTHGVAWLVQAAALLGQRDRAMELFDLLNPIHHGDTRDKVSRYKTEPYVLAGDVYGEAPLAGRGGWTWYTGSASWLYRIALEDILGFHVRGARLTLAPCVPANWPRYEIVYRYKSATYQIQVENPPGGKGAVQSVAVDGVVAADGVIELMDDGKRHDVRVLLG